MSVVRYVIIVGVDSDENNAGYGIVTEEVFDNHHSDLATLLWGEGSRDLTPDTEQEEQEETASDSKCLRADLWSEVEAYVRSQNGHIASVHGAIVY